MHDNMNKDWQVIGAWAWSTRIVNDGLLGHKERLVGTVTENLLLANLSECPELPNIDEERRFTLPISERA